MTAAWARGRAVRAVRWLIAAAAAVVVTALPALGTTPVELFESGNGAYEQGRYEEAARAYETILGYGVRDPRVLYNLGNAYYKMGRLGASILAYERAMRLDPSDPELRDNLELARGRIRDRVPEPQLPYPVAVVTSILDGLSVDGLTVLFLLPYLAACGIGGAWSLVRGAVRRRILTYVGAAFALAAVVIGAGLAYRVAETGSRRAVVMSEKVDALSGPAGDNTVLFSVHEGTLLEVRNRRGDWLQVTLPNGLSGWIPAHDVERV